MSRLAAWLTMMSVALVTTISFAQPAPGDPFELLKPSISFTDKERHQLDARDIVLKILPADGHELAVLVAGSLKVDGPALVAKLNDIAALKRAPHVPEIERFSNPPTLGDLANLTLDNVDLDAIDECRPGHCALKLADDEIAQLHRAGADGGSAQRAAVTAQFRRLVLDRINRYLTTGLSGVLPYDNVDRSNGLPAAFSTLLGHSAFIQSQAPDLAVYLLHYPTIPAPDTVTTSFLYWSKETYAWKPIISVTHVRIARPRQSAGAPELMVVENDIFATRYTSGALVLTLLMRGASPEAPHYLIYVNREWVDGLRGLWRPFVDYHIRHEAPDVFAAARERIEDVITTQPAAPASTDGRRDP